MNFDNNIPIYIQIVETVKIQIISGILEPGERLLSVREMALQMKVNPNTIQKALQELEELKLIYTERTNGKFITTDEKLIKKYKEENLLCTEFGSIVKYGNQNNIRTDYYLNAANDYTISKYLGLNSKSVTISIEADNNQINDIKNKEQINTICSLFFTI